LRSFSLVPLLLAVTPALAEPWSFTDGSGQTIALEEAPARIIASQDAAAALIALGVRPVAIYAFSAPAEAKTLQGLDLDGIEIIGQAYGEIDIEKAAALQPDLIVDEYWPETKEWGGVGAEMAAALSALAPVTGVTIAPSNIALIERYEDFALSLGASPEFGATDKVRFETARDAFSAALAAKPGLTVLAAGARDAFYVAEPGLSPELTDFVAWGMTIVSPEEINSRGYFEALSWENVDKYQADLLILDNRSVDRQTAEAQPTWTTLKAAAAGAVAEWPAWWLRNYGAYASELEKLTVAINSADPALVE
jgi:iron complex transport system substrate-binding protein